jgi:S1-C subfamily serine protease
LSFLSMRRLWLVFSQAVTVAVAVVFVLATLKPDWLSGPGRGGASVPLLVPSPATAARSASATLGQVSYAQAARSAAPSVVSVLTQTRSQGSPRGAEPWFRRYFNEPESGMGSAVIVSADGYLLTNNHVVEGATQIEVALSDGKRSKATVVGTDPESDLAVLKVQAEGLPAITFGDADALQVGDVVLAIGNQIGRAHV